VAIEAGDPTASLAAVLEPAQGVTPGAALDVFLFDRAQVAALGLERPLLFRAVKSVDLRRWAVRWQGRSLLYPYVSPPGGAADRWLPAFRTGGDGKLRDGDGLELAQAEDEHERVLLRRGADERARRQVLDYRIARQSIAYPASARYLVGHYDRLSERVFEKKNIREFGKAWYEYHRPRDARKLLLRPALIVRRLVREPSFALVERRLLSDDAVFFLLPTVPGAARRADLAARLGEALGRPATARDVLLWALAFANHPTVFTRCVAGRQKTPKGSYQVSEAFLREVPVPDPPVRGAAAVREAIELVDRLVAGDGDAEPLERRLWALVEPWLAG
jgi:hypothetical protein